MEITRAFESYFSGFIEFNRKGNDKRINFVAALKIAACVTVLLGFTIPFAFAYGAATLYGRVTNKHPVICMKNVLEAAKNSNEIDIGVIEEILNDPSFVDGTCASRSKYLKAKTQEIDDRDVLWFAWGGEQPT